VAGVQKASVALRARGVFSYNMRSETDSWWQFPVLAHSRAKMAYVSASSSTWVSKRSTFLSHINLNSFRKVISRSTHSELYKMLAAPVVPRSS
jgi:hypothetical protein